MKNIIIATAIATMLTTTTLACPTMVNYGYCTCGMCGGGIQQACQQTACYDRTGEGYYDSMGHYCEYGGYWDGGCWIQTVGYYEGGEWCPAQYDPMLDVGYYDEHGTYHSYYGQYAWDRSQGCSYGSIDVWAADNPYWLEANGYGNPLYCGGYEECGYEDYEAYEDCGSGDYYIDLDLDAGVINIINNGVVVVSGTCVCSPVYRGQELAFGDQRCAGIWNQCSGGFYEQACGYDISSVCCH